MCRSVYAERPARSLPQPFDDMPDRQTLIVAGLLTTTALARFAGADEASSTAAVADYLQDVKPLLERHCIVCHGPEKQQASLRLDTAELAIQGGDSGPAIIPGNSSESRLFLSVTGESVEASQMPLDQDPLSESEIDLLKRWIDAGAVHPDDEVAAPLRVETDHWSFQPIRRPPVPTPGTNDETGMTWTNPIDAFIQTRLGKEGLTAAPEADRISLIRRVTLDLTGLPPTSGDVDAFLADTQPGAYERVVDRLMASPHYGERWGRHWLDAARYADSNGFTIDGGRTMWPYRDWVVRAFNADMPFDQFTIEQLAGDLLTQPTIEQLVATGFHRNTLANQEGGTDDEQFRVESIVDRVNTTSTVWMGLTMACAQCHDHKYDPISQRDFYRLFAVFNNTADNNDAGGLAPKVSLPSPAQDAALKDLTAEINAAIADRRERELALATEMREWEATLDDREPVDWNDVAPSAAVSSGGATMDVLADRSVLVSGQIPENDTYQITLPIGESTVTAVRLETLTHKSLPKSGPGLASNGNFVLGEFALTLGDRPIKIATAMADHSQDGHAVGRAIDGNEKQGWAINVASGNMNVDREAVFILAEPLVAPASGAVTVTMTFRHPRGYQIGRFRLSTTSADRRSVGMPDQLLELAAIKRGDRTDGQQQELIRRYREQDPEWTSRQKHVAALQQRQKTLQAAVPTSLILRELDEPRESYVHIRGDFLRKGAAVEPGVPRVLPEVETDAPTRLDLARWLVDPGHPLTARVTVNRIWQRFFGRGLVETENDFGLQGVSPTHPDLLDWLASELQNQQWSLKSLHRLIVTSHTYRQSSHRRADAESLDPMNKLLARQSRLRLEAETIRDVALAASGLLSHKLGGPPVHPPQPEGIYVLTQNKKPWTVATNEDRFRRGMYTQFWRSSPHPMMPTFDAPDANTSCTRRVRSNTPLQALTLANDRSFVELAEGLAARVLSDGPDYDEGRLRQVFQVALSRPPTSEELSRLSEFLADQRQRFSDHRGAAAELLSERTAALDSVEAATWTALGRVVMNLDEFITRE